MTVDDIIATISTVGSLCGAEERADILTEEIENRIEQVMLNVDHTVSPRILVVIERTVGTGSLSDIYVAGRGTLYNELIWYAGGVNAYAGPDIDYPVLSAEGLLQLNPDIIIDLIPNLEESGLTAS